MSTRRWVPSEDQMLCRDLQHPWAPYLAERTSSGFTRTLQCRRCGARKKQTMTTSGYITGTWMQYPPGYLRQGGGRLTADDKAALRVTNMNVGGYA